MTVDVNYELDPHEFIRYSLNRNFSTAANVQWIWIYKFFNLQVATRVLQEFQYQLEMWFIQLVETTEDKSLESEIRICIMPRGNKIAHSGDNSMFGAGKSYQDINIEIYWICIVMASIITFLIVLALSYIAYEKWQRYRELQ